MTPEQIADEIVSFPKYSEDRVALRQRIARGMRAYVAQEAKPLVEALEYCDAEMRNMGHTAQHSLALIGGKVHVTLTTFKERNNG